MNDIQSKKIAIYCRVSTDEQAKEGMSLDEQRTRLQAYVRAMGWSTEVQEFIDDGYSAKNMERPALQEILKQVQDGKISRLMVTKLDRLSRRLLDLLTLIELFHNYNVSLVSTSESFDTDTPSGRLTLQVLGAVAEFERERIRERVFENMLHAAKSGKWLTQHPYGYRLQDKELIVYEPESEVVKRVYKMFLEDGLGYYSIAKRLNEEGIPSRQNKEWSLRSIKLMLTNPVYKGTLVWNRVDSSKKNRRVKEDDEWIVVPDAVPVIIEKDIWNKVQDRINNTQKTPPRSKTSPHLLGGLLRCGKCGASMSIGWSGWPKRHRVYQCSSYKNKGTCTSKPYRADEVEKWFKEGLMQLVGSVDTSFHEVVINRIEAENKEKLEQKIRAAKTRYNRMVEAYTSGLIEIKDLKKEKENMEREIEESQFKKESSKHPPDLEEIESDLKKQAVDVIEAIELLPVEEAKAKISTLVKKVIVKDAEQLEILLEI